MGLGYTLGFSIITASMWLSNNQYAWIGATIMTIMCIGAFFIPYTKYFTKN